MKRSILFLAAGTTIVAAGVAVHQARLGALERESVVATRSRLSQLDRELANLLRQLDDAHRDLESAKQRLASMSPMSVVPATESDLTSAAQISEWIAKVKRLQKEFIDHPDQRIPEMQLLTDLDWASVAREAKFDSDADVRKARALARDAAKRNFHVPLRDALRRFSQATTGSQLTDVLQLAPYFNEPIDPAMLQRYEISPTIGGSRPAPAVAERAAIDREFDYRHTVTAGGGGHGPWITNPLRKVTQDAFNNFAAANAGRRPKSDSELLPYVQDPVGKALLGAMADYKQAHHGLPWESLADLRAYVKDPAAQAALEHLIATTEENRSK